MATLEGRGTSDRPAATLAMVFTMGQANVVFPLWARRRICHSMVLRTMDSSTRWVALTRRRVVQARRPAQGARRCGWKLRVRGRLLARQGRSPVQQERFGHRVEQLHDALQALQRFMADVGKDGVTAGRYACGSRPARRSASGADVDQQPAV